MSSSYRPRAAASGLVALVAALLIASGAYGASRVKYAGKTSQHQPISFAISTGKLVGLTLRIDIRCPSHHTYRLKTSGFTAITVKNASFDQKFTAKNPKATFTFKGKIARKKVAGSLSLREFVSVERRVCFGAATFTARSRN